MDLSVIIVNYNVQYFLEQALWSVRKAVVGLSAEIFVVDNQSSDGSVAMVRACFPEVRLIANEKNSGFSVANNQAIREARGKYILLLNPDTVVQEDTFRKCFLFMEQHSEAGALGVKMIDGAGQFLPESKRGFPSPFVAFCKTFGLSQLFPKSRTFNRYHLGFLDADQTHEIDVLAGAFMWLRAAALQEVGLLDEAFFMYGEDIDLSYRIVQGGWKNYYLPTTTIIHYKGESTKRGSLNYVRTFYQAMIIFAKKHFKGSQAWLFIGMLRAAIYFRAFLTLLNNGLQKIHLPVLDVIFMYGGMFFIKNYWATHHYKNPDYYAPSFLYLNIPIYISIWLSAVYFSGGYDERYNLQRLARGLFIGTVLLAAVYGFLPTDYRTSRMLIILSALWALLSAIGVRLCLHYFQYKNWNISSYNNKKLAIVGSPSEADRVQKLIFKAQIQQNLIGIIHISDDKIKKSPQIGLLSQLDTLVAIYRLNEIIFCAKDVSNAQIIAAMARLGSATNYKIVSESSESIVGSNSKYSSGELYLVKVKFRIAEPFQRRNKRLFDIILALVGLLLLPIFIFLVQQKKLFIHYLFQILRNQRTWVGYAAPPSADLPPLPKSLFSPIDRFKHREIDDNLRQKANYMYAKDYTPLLDFELIWGSRKNL